ncbi:MAG: helicase-associated domain-containing protein [Gemmataceae bacterium]|nr:helicase-associated domain-containing protein [Gemmataceae bacterium]
MPSPDPDDWSVRVRDALGRYDEPLLRAVAGRLVKPRTNQPADDLLDKAVGILTNPPQIDRRIKELPPSSRKLLALIGLSRQPRWAVGHLLTLLASLGHAEGFAPVRAALDAGLLYPELPPDGPPLDDFDRWLGAGGTLAAVAFAHPAVAARARGEDLELPDLASGGREPPGSPARQADGLEWPLRLAAVWQQVGGSAVRLTQANTLFKRDQTRLQGDEVLAALPADHLAPSPDLGILALFWAKAAGLLAEADGELRPGSFPSAWDAGLTPAVSQLFAALPHVEAWDPLAGYAPVESGLSGFPTAGLLSLLLLASGGRQPPDGKPNQGADAPRSPGWTDPAAVAGWLWENHPSWAGGSPAATTDRGAGWVEGFLLGVAYPLRLVEAVPAADGWAVRLSDLGRHLLAGGPEPVVPPLPPQTLLVQPNAEVLAFRQGLTPGLVAALSRFARWKGIGPACTLELTPEQTYRGLESGLTLPMVLQTLARHSTRPVPPGVADLLQRWANKRDRITVFASAVLVEFPTPADLDAALARGVVSVKLTDRVGMTADGAEPGLSQLRLIGNRDYEAKPQRCVSVGDDGVTLTVDAAQADLLLDAEIGRYAEPLPPETPGVRRFRLTPATVRRAADAGLSFADIDGWFVDRTGGPLPPAGRLFLFGGKVPPPTAARRLVVRFSSAELADGVVQWPETRRLIADRLGPTAVVVEEEAFDPLRRVLAEVGVTLEEI